VAIQLVKKEKEYKYIPVSERKEKNPTTFVFRPLTKEEKASLEDRILTINPDQSITLANASYLLAVLKIALKRVENILDEKGKLTVKDFTNTEVSDEFIEMLPDDLVQEVANVIIAVSKDPQNADIYLGQTSDNNEDGTDEQ